MYEKRDLSETARLQHFLSYDLELMSFKPIGWISSIKSLDRYVGCSGRLALIFHLENFRSRLLRVDSFQNNRDYS